VTAAVLAPVIQDGVGSVGFLELAHVSTFKLVIRDPGVLFELVET